MTGGDVTIADDGTQVGNLMVAAWPGGVDARAAGAVDTDAKATAGSTKCRKVSPVGMKKQVQVSGPSLGPVWARCRRPDPGCLSGGPAGP